MPSSSTRQGFHGEQGHDGGFCRFGGFQDPLIDHPWFQTEPQFRQNVTSKFPREDFNAYFFSRFLIIEFYLFWRKIKWRASASLFKNWSNMAWRWPTYHHWLKKYYQYLIRGRSDRRYRGIWQKQVTAVTEWCTLILYLRFKSIIPKPQAIWNEFHVYDVRGRVFFFSENEKDLYPKPVTNSGLL